MCALGRSSQSSAPERDSVKGRGRTHPSKTERHNRDAVQRPPESQELLRCSFCNKSERQVKRLIAGPAVHISNECVGICLAIVNEDAKDEAQQPDNSDEHARAIPPALRATLEFAACGLRTSTPPVSTMSRPTGPARYFAAHGHAARQDGSQRPSERRADDDHGQTISAAQIDNQRT